MSKSLSKSQSKPSRWTSFVLLAAVAASLTFMVTLMAPTAEAAIPGPVITGCFLDAIKNVEAGCCQEPDVRRYEVWLCDVDSRFNLYWSFQGYRCVEGLDCP